LSANGVFAGAPCFDKNIDHAIVFNCASAATSPAGCTTTVVSPLDATYDYDLTIWYPCNQTAPTDTNCCYLPAVGYSTPFDAWCISTGSNSFIIAEQVKMQQSPPDAGVAPDLAPELPLDGGACPWPASLTSSNDASTIGCWAHVNTNVCQIPAGDVVDSHGTILGPDGTPVTDASCQHSCIASEYLVWCMGDETSSSPFTVPEPDSSLGCRVLAGPTAALTAYFCCPCGPGQ